MEDACICNNMDIGLLFMVLPSGDMSDLKS